MPWTYLRIRDTCVFEGSMFPYLLRLTWILSYSLRADPSMEPPDSGRRLWTIQPSQRSQRMERDVRPKNGKESVRVQFLSRTPFVPLKGTLEPLELFVLIWVRSRKL